VWVWVLLSPWFGDEKETLEDRMQNSDYHGNSGKKRAIFMEMAERLS